MSDTASAQVSSNNPPAHTPGPWKTLTLTHYGPDSAIYIVPESNDLHPLATVWLNPAEHPSGENESNATVMAAGPDLLAALKTVRAALNCHYDSAVIESEYGSVIDAAIAKAGGTR